MATTGAKRVFVDTNVLVFSTTQFSPFREAAVRALTELKQSGDEAWISRQVIREYLSVQTRHQGFNHALDIHAVVDSARRMESAFKIAEDGPDVCQRLFELLERVPCGGKQVHDANIVATMLARGVTHLLTGNAADFKRFEPEITIVAL